VSTSTIDLHLIMGRGGAGKSLAKTHSITQAVCLFACLKGQAVSDGYYYYYYHSTHLIHDRESRLEAVASEGAHLFSTARLLTAKL